MAKKFRLRNLVHCPEFLTAANAKHVFVNDDRPVIGSSYLRDNIEEKYSEIKRVVTTRNATQTTIGGAK